MEADHGDIDVMFSEAMGCVGGDEVGQVCVRFEENVPCVVSACLEVHLNAGGVLNLSLFKDKFADLGWGDVGGFDIVCFCDFYQFELNQGV